MVRTPRATSRTQVLRNVLKRIGHALHVMEWLWITVAAVIMFAIMIIVFMDVVGRYFFNASLVVRAYKRLIEMTMRVPLEAAMEFETELFGPVWVSEDHDECVRAFFEKRAPRLVGR